MKAIIKTILLNENLYKNLGIDLKPLEKDILIQHYVNNLELLNVAEKLRLSHSWV